MNKSIELTQSQIKAYENGATMFLFFANKYRVESEYDICKFPIKKGDKDIFVQEKFVDEYPHGICIRKDYDEEDWQELDENGYINKASKMTKEQSRYSFKECTNIQAIRVIDICGNDKANIIGEEDKIGYILDDFKSFYNQQLKEQSINRIYDDNDYVFLVEFKR